MDLEAAGGRGIMPSVLIVMLLIFFKYSKIFHIFYLKEKTNTSKYSYPGTNFHTTRVRIIPCQVKQAVATMLPILFF